jgi:acylglycerol lipase
VTTISIARIMPSSKNKKLLQRVAAFGAAFLSFTAFGATSAIAEVVRNDNSQDLVRSGIPLYEWQNTSIKEPKCIVVAVHGAAQQGGVLDTLGRSLASLGYLVLAPDLRGAGRWSMMAPQPSKGTFSEFVESCNDLDRLLKLLRKEHPKSSLFCIGESAGSTVVLSAMVRDATRCKGIILCSAGSEPKLHAPGSMGPEFYKKLMHVTTPVDMSEFMGKYSSDDKRISDEMINDPLGRNKLSALELLGTFNFIQQGNVFATQIPRSLPTLLIQGQQDQIINANSSVKLLGKLASTDKNILMLPSSGHILIGTTYVKPEVEDAIIDWLAAHGGLKGGMVSHVMPPNAPDFHTFSRSRMPGNDAMRGGGYSPVNAQAQGQDALPPTPFSSMPSPVAPSFSSEPLTPFSSMPGAQMPRYRPAQPPALSSEQSTVSRNAPASRGEDSATAPSSAASGALSPISADSTQMKTTATATSAIDTIGSTLQPDRPETPPPSLSELLHSLGDKSGAQNDVQGTPSSDVPGGAASGAASAAGGSEPAQNQAVNKVDADKDSMPPLRESAKP